MSAPETGGRHLPGCDCGLPGPDGVHGYNVACDAGAMRPHVQPKGKSMRVASGALQVQTPQPCELFGDSEAIVVSVAPGRPAPYVQKVARVH